jgi:hypothetical protein
MPSDSRIARAALALDPLIKHYIISFEMGWKEVVQDHVIDSSLQLGISPFKNPTLGDRVLL